MSTKSPASTPAAAAASDTIVHDDDHLLLRLHKWMKKEHPWPLILLAAVVATLAFLSGVNPPGGYWHDDKAGHVAGEPVLRYRSESAYRWFWHLNGISFFTSIILMALVSTDRFYRTPARMTALLLIALFDVSCLVAAYIVGTAAAA